MSEQGKTTRQHREDKQFDLASVFPAKGDPRRPPEWFGRGLLYIVIAVYLAVIVWRSAGELEYLVVDLVISVFIALAVEPLVLAMVKHGWKRGAASAVTLVGLVVVIVGLLGMFGNMFVQQMISLVRGLPDAYDQIAAFVAANTSFRMPAIQNLGTEIINNIQTSWVTNFATQAATTLGSIGSMLLNVMTITLVTYYVSACSPRMRRSLCQWLSPDSQRRFVLVWQVVQDQISNFLFSRGILAIINAVCTAVFLEVLNVPYWLPLALFCGLTSQFVPTVGTYIGGALPVLFAWINGGLWYAVGVLVYIIIYQQIENMILSPMISQRTMDLNAAVSFLVVLALGSLFGALGAFLALPVTASLQAIFRAYTRRYDLVDSPLMNDPVGRKSKVVAASEAFSEHVLHPVAEHMPRAAKGSTSRVPMNDEIRRLQEEIYAIPWNECGDGASVGRAADEESATVAIPQGVLKHNAAKGLAGRGADDAARDVDDAGASGSAAPVAADDAQDAAGSGSDSSDNPRARWR